MHQRQPAHMQNSALSYYPHERETSFHYNVGRRGEGRKKRHHAELKQEKANLFLKGIKKCSKKVSIL